MDLLVWGRVSGSIFVNEHIVFDYIDNPSKVQSKTSSKSPSIQIDKKILQKENDLDGQKHSLYPSEDTFNRYKGPFYKVQLHNIFPNQPHIYFCNAGHRV